LDLNFQPSSRAKLFFPSFKTKVKDDLDLGYLPRLVRGLSLKGAIQICILKEPEPKQVDALFKSLTPPSKRSSLVLSFLFDGAKRADFNPPFKSFVAPRLALLLRPDGLCNGIIERDGRPRK